MKCRLHYPTSSTIPDKDRFTELPIFEGLWSDSADAYAAEFLGKQSTGGRTPKGIQKYLNEYLDTRMKELDWIGSDGRYFRDQQWIRVTFRHSMSLGSDILDALRMHYVEGYERVTLVAASPVFLKAITPSDAGSICSSDALKLQVELNAGILNIPLAIGTLEPASKLKQRTHQIVYGKR